MQINKQDGVGGLNKIMCLRHSWEANKFLWVVAGRRQTKETERNGDQGGRAAAFGMK